MLNKDNIFSGLVVGLLLPLTIFLMLYQIFNLLELRGAASVEGLGVNFRQRTLAIVAIAANIIPLKIFQNRRFDQSMRGIVVITTIWAVIWVVKFGLDLM